MHLALVPPRRPNYLEVASGGEKPPSGPCYTRLLGLLSAEVEDIDVGTLLFYRRGIQSSAQMAYNIATRIEIEGRSASTSYVS